MPSCCTPTQRQRRPWASPLAANTAGATAGAKAGAAGGAVAGTAAPQAPYCCCFPRKLPRRALRQAHPQRLTTQWSGASAAAAAVGAATAAAAMCWLLTACWCAPSAPRAVRTALPLPHPLQTLGATQPAAARRHLACGCLTGALTRTDAGRQLAPRPSSPAPRPAPHTPADAPVGVALLFDAWRYPATGEVGRPGFARVPPAELPSDAALAAAGAAVRAQADAVRALKQQGGLPNQVRAARLRVLPDGVRANLSSDCTAAGACQRTAAGDQQHAQAPAQTPRSLHRHRPSPVPAAPPGTTAPRRASGGGRAGRAQGGARAA